MTDWILVVLSLFIVSCGSLGWGFLYRRWFGVPEDTAKNLGFLGILGLAVVAVVGIATNMLLPLSTPVSTALMAVGLIGLVVHWRRSVMGRHQALLAVAAFVAVSISCFWAFPDGDTGLYHLGAILWNRETAVPLGLANLHGRFGLNSSWFVVSAVAWLPGLGSRTAFVINGCMLWFFLLYCEGVMRTNSDRLALAFLSTALAVWLCLPQFYEHQLGSPSTDLPAALLFLVLFHHFLVSLALPHGFSSPGSGAALFLAVFAVTVKLSMLPLLAAFAVQLLFQHRRLKSDSLLLSCWRWYIPAGCLALGWVLRGIFLSGCALFPARSTCFSGLPWAVPLAEVDIWASWIKSWARLPGPPPEVVLRDWTWVWKWMNALRASEIARVVLFLVLLGTACGLYRVRPDKAREPAGRGEFVGGMILSLICLSYWFLTAPDLRFGSSFLLGAATLIACYGLTRSGGAVTAILSRHFGQLTALLVTGMLCRVLAVAALSGSPSLPPGWPPVRPGWPRLPTPATDTRRTVSGYEVRIPVIGAACWDAALPCTPPANFNPKIANRRVSFLGIERQIFTNK